MPRLSSYRDFDWVLLGFVLLLSVISVLEIKSATLHTKFHGFDHKQIEFLAVGLVLMFLISLIDYHRLIDIVPWAVAVSIAALIAVKLVGTKVLGARRLENTDLSSIRSIYNGAEPISASLCNEFMNTLAYTGLKRSAMYPVYGLAEASLGVAFPPQNAATRFPCA